MFYQLLRVQHGCSSTQSWGSVLPSIVKMRDQNSRGCSLLFSNRNLGSFCASGTEILYTHSLWEVVDHSRSKMHETCLIIIHDIIHLMCEQGGGGKIYWSMLGALKGGTACQSVVMLGPGGSPEPPSLG